jgi:cobalt-zinc-cadmium efflux system outer membrane protein
MRFAQFVALTSVSALLLQAAQCREKEEAFQSLQQSVRERTGKTVRWEEDGAARDATLQQVRTLLRRPLTVNSVVEIALLNNRDLQATFEQLGLSAADLKEAGTFPNPTFNLSARFPDKPPSGTDVEYSLAIDFLNIVMIPLKKRVARDQLESVALRVADQTLELVSEVKGAFYSLQATQQLLSRFKLIVATSAAALDLAQRQHEAGNTSDLSLAEQQAMYSRSRLDVAMADADIRKNREKLNRLLGLWGADTAWGISGDLPKVPEAGLPIQGLERLAISQRLDLQADYLQAKSLAKALGLTKDFRFLGALDFGLDSERSSDSQTITGPTFAIELPIFNQGQARVARAEAALRQAQKKFEALAINVRSQVRELRDEVESKREIARFCQEELLPGQMQILNQSLLNYNAMAIGSFELFAAKAEEARTEREYINAVRDYWIARAELERAVGGNLNPRQPVNGKSQPSSNSMQSRPAKGINQK